ncbi:M20 peptidase aminoacylase family protein [Sporosarcina sp. P29]|uniref:M20 peptidase aminoacylase family protein n=1 Tax=Sporosarcina sp. P29 TaxID=2048252 RepID=UPI000C16AE38|nr:M20 peptidase aminoacylase family protein [Sporosarcina sp. P29]PID00942.1 amidohydrolase [Sporosarcina sp. P29]
MNEQVQLLKPKLDEVFAHLHSHPEVSWKETKTTAYLKGYLEREGFNVHVFDGITGLYVTIGEGKPIVGLRVDIDALWQEVDGVYRANHSCGHDGHMTMGVGALLMAKERGIPQKGTLKVFFQPAEEKGKGALAVLEQGLIDDIDYLFGVHVRAADEMADGCSAASLRHGAAKMISGTIKGTEAHGARPHQGKNAIEVGASLVGGLQSIHCNPMVSHSAKMTMFQAGGESANIIPGNAKFSLDLRAQENKVMDELYEKVERVIQAIEKQYDVEINYEVMAEMVAAEVNTEAEDLLYQAIAKVVGEEKTTRTVVTPGGEDFHFYSVKRPTVKSTMLGLGCGLTPGLHHPDMTFNQDALATGVEILTTAIELTFQSKK